MNLQILSSPDQGGSSVSSIPSPSQDLMEDDLVTSAEETVSMGSTDSDVEL